MTAAEPPFDLLFWKRGGAFYLLGKAVLGVSEIRNVQSLHAWGRDMGFGIVEYC